MPLAAPVLSGHGVANPRRLELIRAQVDGPMIVDAGLATASDAAEAMELGADAVIMNAAMAEADDPVGMAKAMRLAVQAGRSAFEAVRVPPGLRDVAGSTPDERVRVRRTRGPA